MLPVWSDQTLTLGDGLSNHMHWTYSLVGDVRASEQTLHKELWVSMVVYEICKAFRFTGFVVFVHTPSSESYRFYTRALFFMDVIAHSRVGKYM